MATPTKDDCRKVVALLVDDPDALQHYQAVLVLGRLSA